MQHKRGSDYYREIGRRGGRATVKKHGRAHMSDIGRRGFAAVTVRRFGGNDRAHRDHMAARMSHLYWRQTGLPMKHDCHGQPVWPDRMPVMPPAAAVSEDELADKVDKLVMFGAF